jgi:hypothetical protein
MKKIKPVEDYLDKILKREYLRGIIDGQKIKLGKNYYLKDLNRIYKQYIKLNPKFRIL